MHRWLRTTAPWLIGSIAVGTIHAAPAVDICTRKNHMLRVMRNITKAEHAAPAMRYALHRVTAESEQDAVRLCAGCHDGTIAPSSFSMRDEAHAPQERESDRR